MMRVIRTILFLGVAVSVVAGCGARSENSDSSGDVIDSDEDFAVIFDGSSLSGWDGDTAYWRVENESLVGEITPEKPLENNSFIIWKGGSPGDFELKLEYRITERGNSGINYRSEALPDIPYALRGYQADIDGKNNYTGQNYEERKRTTLAYRGEVVTVRGQQDADGALHDYVKNNAWIPREVTGSLGDDDSLRSIIKADDWNSCHIIAEGNRLRHYINGVLMSDVTDEDSLNRSDSGLLGMQIHKGPPMKVEYRNIRLKML
jgi:hypothetical protein